MIEDTGGPIWGFFIGNQNGIEMNKSHEQRYVSFVLKFIFLYMYYK